VIFSLITKHRFCIILVNQMITTIKSSQLFLNSAIIRHRFNRD